MITLIMILSSLFTLLSFSPSAGAYDMPNGVYWYMDDLVNNSAGAVTGAIGGPYTVHENVNVTNSSTLIFQAGDDIRFDLGTGFTIFGELNAWGTNANMIYLNSSEIAFQIGDWNGLHYYGGTGHLDYVQLTYADIGIHVEGDFVNITSSRIEQNRWGLVADYSYVDIFNSYINYNRGTSDPNPSLSDGGGVWAMNSANVDIRDYNMNDNTGAVRVTSNAYVDLRNTNIERNVDYGVYIDGSASLYLNNNVLFFSDYGVYDAGSNSLTLLNNNIQANDIGIHIDSPNLSNGQIFNNLIHLSPQAGLEIFDGSPSIYGNNITSNSMYGMKIFGGSPDIYDNVVYNSGSVGALLDGVPDLAMNLMSFQLNDVASVL